MKIILLLKSWPALAAALVVAVSLKVKLPQVKKVQQARMDSLYQSDVDATYKASWENPEIQDLYKQFLGNLFPNVLK